MADAPVAIDGSDGPLVVRKIVVWRRLEPGDVRTPGTEIAPESPHLEAKIVEVGIAEELREDLARLWEKKEEATAIAQRWTARYEPAGVLWAIGGGGLVGTALDYLPFFMFWVSGTFALLGIAVGAYTRANKAKLEAEADRKWRKTKERDRLESVRKRLEPRWRRFAKRLLEDEGFRTEVGVGDIHEADRLASIEMARITHPDTWKPDDAPNEVRYGWVFADGRYAEQVAELEEPDVKANGAKAKDEEE